MSDNAQEKAFDPTASRLEKARHDGNSPRSADVSSNAAFLGASLTFAASMPFFGTAVMQLLQDAAGGRMSPHSVVAALGFAFMPLFGAACCAILAGLAQSKGLRVVALKIDVSRLHPTQGLTRMFSRESLTQVLRAFVACAIASVVASTTLRTLLGLVSQVPTVSSIAVGVWSSLRLTVGALVFLGVLFAALDYSIVRKNWIKKLRMSFAEVKREVREHDGDPYQRGRRRSIHRSLAQGSIQGIREAAFVIANPTHICIAFAYTPPKIVVPKILIRAEGLVAQRVRELATELHIPIIENVTLARALYAQTRVGEELPGEHFLAIAQIVAELTKQGLLQR